MEELLKKMEAQAKKDVAALLKNQIELAFEAAVLHAAEEVKAKIPGTVDDAIISIVVPVVVPVIKAELLKQIEKLEG